MSYHKLNSPKQKSFFTKRHSVFFKGLAIILLVLHHLFGCRTFLVDPDIKWVGIPFFNIIGSNEARGAAAPLFGKFKESGGMSLLGFELGDFGKLGLSLFIFISGYGIFCAISRYRTVKEMYRAVAVRLKNFLVRWWVILALIAVPVAICLKKFSFKLLLVNILPVICDFKTLFIGFSWYVWVYVMFLLAAPAFIKLMSKNLWQNLAAFVLLPYVFSVVIDKLGGVSFADVNTRSLFSVAGFILLQSFYNFCTHFPLFALGAIFAKHALFEEMDGLLAQIRTNTYRKAVCALILIAVFLLRLKANFFIITDAVYVPLFVFCTEYLIGNKTKGKAFVFVSLLGYYSLEIWLIHGVFFAMTSVLQPIIFWPRYSVLIFVWCIALCLGIAWSMHKIADMVQPYVSKFCRKILGLRGAK